MQQNKLLEITRKAIDAPEKYTEAALILTEKLKHPSKKVNRIGSAIGSCLGIALLAVSLIQGAAGNRLPALGALTAGICTLVSGFISSRKKDS